MITRWSNTSKYLGAAVLVLGTLGLIIIARPFVPSIVMAAILAFLLHPVVRFFHRRLRFPRALAAIVTYILLLVIIALVPILLTPVAIDAARSIRVEVFVEWFQDQASNVRQILLNVRTLRFMGLRLSLASIVDPALELLAGSTPSELPSVEEWLQLIPGALGSVTTAAGYLAAAISAAAFTAFLTLIVSVYLAVDANVMYHNIVELVPTGFQDEIKALMNRILHVWSAYFRGQLTVSFILWMLTWLGATAVGLPGAFLLGLTAGILALIPSLGPILSFFPAGIVALVQGSTVIPVSNLTFVFIVGALYLVIQQLEGNFITPRIVGHAIDLPPVVVLLSVMVGMSAAGVLGAILASPTLATIRVLANYIWDKITDRDPMIFLKGVKPPPPTPTPLVQTAMATYVQLQDRYHQLVENGEENTGSEEEE